MVCFSIISDTEEDEGNDEDFDSMSDNNSNTFYTYFNMCQVSTITNSLKNFLFLIKFKNFMRNNNSDNDLSSLRNIGPTIQKRLHEIGINSKKDLKNVGPVLAYQKIQSMNPDKTIPVCYYLYSLQGALENKHWDDISKNKKQKLLDQVK